MNNNIFSRWSFNSLVISFLASTLFLSIGILYIMNASKNSYGTGGELPLALFLIFYYFCFQTLALLIAFIIVLVEINPDYRVKNKILLKIFSNIFYKIFATIIAIAEIVLMAFSLYAVIDLAPSFL